MDFAFSTTDLRDVCEDRSVAVQTHGVHASRELGERLADMEAYPTVGEFIALFVEDIIFRSPTELAVRLKAGYAIVFCAGHVEIPLDDNGETDWSRVSKIKITALEVVS